MGRCGYEWESRLVGETVEGRVGSLVAVGRSLVVEEDRVVDWDGADRLWWRRKRPWWCRSQDFDRSDRGSWD